MSRTARGRTIRTIRATVIALLGISVLAIPTVNAQRPETSPATLDIKANPSFANAAAIRGTTFSNSSGPDDIPSGLIGHATGNAEGTDGLVRAVFGLSNGNAVGHDSRVAGVEGRTSGDALGSGATVFAVRGTATGSALGDNFSLVGGVDGRSRGNAVA